MLKIFPLFYWVFFNKNEGKANGRRAWACISATERLGDESANQQET
jgi:hypothetical protein